MGGNLAALERSVPAEPHMVARMTPHFRTAVLHMPLTAPARLLLPCFAWIEQIDDWRDTRPILECLGQMRRLNHCLFCELGNALCDRKHAHDLFSCELELPNRCRE